MILLQMLLQSKCTVARDVFNCVLRIQHFDVTHVPWSGRLKFTKMERVCNKFSTYAAGPSRHCRQTKYMQCSHNWPWLAASALASLVSTSDCLEYLIWSESLLSRSCFQRRHTLIAICAEKTVSTKRKSGFWSCHQVILIRVIRMHEDSSRFRFSPRTWSYLDIERKKKM